MRQLSLCLEVEASTSEAGCALSWGLDYVTSRDPCQLWFFSLFFCVCNWCNCGPNPFQVVLALEGILTLLHSSAVAASVPPRKCFFRVNHPPLMQHWEAASLGRLEGISQTGPNEGTILFHVSVAGERWALCWSLAQVQLPLGCPISRASPRNTYILHVWIWHHSCLLGCHKSRSFSKADEVPQRWDTQYVQLQLSQ